MRRSARVTALSRRMFLSLLGQMAAGTGFGQMATRGLKPAPRGKPSGLPFHAHFTDVGAQAGLKEAVIAGHLDHDDYILESTSCGVAFFDYDNDGWLDILVLTGSRVDDPPPNASNRLYKNNRDGTFTDVTVKAGLFRTGYFFGVTIGDYNNDGFEDLFITGYPRNVLYRNNGDGTFADVTKDAGLMTGPAPRFGSGCTFVDFNRDGWLDLFVSNYTGFDTRVVPRPSDDSSDPLFGIYLGPFGLPHGKHSLYHNNGDGTFTNVTESAGISKADGGYGLTAVAADFDNDGWPDIYLACDSTPSLYFKNNRDGTFSEEAMERGVALSEDGMEQAGMGLGIGDVLMNGNLNIVKTHFEGDTAGLFVNNGKGSFEDATIRFGLAVETRYITWGVGIQDLDNDGYPDIFWVTGGIYPGRHTKPGKAPAQTPRVLFRNLGNGRFEELLSEGGPGVDELHISRGCAFGDFDNDGDVDIVIVNQNEPPSLLRNDVTGDNHWIKIKLEGVKSNRSAIGARVEARYDGKLQAQEVLAQSSYLSANDTRLHFGLGSALVADVSLRWPSGLNQSLSGLKADRLYTIKEGVGVVPNRGWR